MTFRGYQEVDGNLWYMSNYIKQRSCLDYAHAMGRNLKEDECCNVSNGPVPNRVWVGGVKKALTADGWSML